MKWFHKWMLAAMTALALAAPLAVAPAARREFPVRGVRPESDLLCLLPGEPFRPWYYLAYRSYDDAQGAAILLDAFGYETTIRVAFNR